MGIAVFLKSLERHIEFLERQIKLLCAYREHTSYGPDENIFPLLQNTC